MTRSGEGVKGRCLPWSKEEEGASNVDLYNDVRNCVKSTQDVNIWMEIPIQHDVYIWTNYSVSCYLNFIPICWNVLNWLKYDFMHIFMYRLFLYFETTAQIPEVEFGGTYGYLRANTDIWGPIRIFAPYLPLRANSQHWLLPIIGHAKTNILQQHMWSFYLLHCSWKTLNDKTYIYFI